MSHLQSLCLTLGFLLCLWAPAHATPTFPHHLRLRQALTALQALPQQHKRTLRQIRRTRQTRQHCQMRWLHHNTTISTSKRDARGYSRRVLERERWRRCQQSMDRRLVRLYQALYLAQRQLRQQRRKLADFPRRSVPKPWRCRPVQAQTRPERVYRAVSASSRSWSLHHRIAYTTNTAKQSGLYVFEGLLSFFAYHQEKGAWLQQAWFRGLTPRTLPLGIVSPAHTERQWHVQVHRAVHQEQFVKLSGKAKKPRKLLFYLRLTGAVRDPADKLALRIRGRLCWLPLTASQLPPDVKPMY